MTLSEYISKHGLNGRKIAERAGMNYGTFRNYASGAYSFSDKQREAIKRALQDIMESQKQDLNRVRI